MFIYSFKKPIDGVEYIKCAFPPPQVLVIQGSCWLFAAT